MTRISHLVALPWLVLALIATNCVAQDDEDEAEPMPRRARDINPVIDLSFSFQHWVFNPYGTEDAMRQALALRLESRMRELDQKYTLSEAQKTKLRLAASIEVKNRFDSIESMRARFELLGNDVTKFRKFVRQTDKERDALFADPFGDGSLFEKVLGRTLVGPQAVKYEAVVRERELAPYRALVDVLITYESQGLGLDDEQRRKLAELLRGATPPIEKAQRLTYDKVILRLAALPERKLEPIFDKRQWNLLSRRIAEAKALSPVARERMPMP